MKKIYKLVSIISCSLVMASGLNAQVITESFASVATLTTTSGWAQQNLSTPVGTNPDWFQGNPTNFNANSGATNEYISVGYNSVAGANTISNWLFTPTRTFNNGDVIKFYTKTAGSYADRLQLRLSVNGTSTNAGATNTSVGDFTTLLLEVNPTQVVANYPTTWTQYTVTISGLPSPLSGRAAFRYFVTNGGPSGANSNMIGIDDFEYIPFGTPTAPDVTVGSYGEYTAIPLAQVTPMTLQTVVKNIGSAAATDAQLKVNVYVGPNYTTPVQTYTSTPANIAASGSLAVNVGTYTPTMVGDYTYEFISACTNNTVTSADTSYYDFSVVNNMYARDNGIPVQGIGAGAGTRVIVGNTFKVNTTTFLDSVLFVCFPGAVGLGDTVSVKISSTTAGVPSNTGYIGFSSIHKFTAAETSTINPAIITLTVSNSTNGRLSLAPGTYFVGIEKHVTSDNYGLQCTDDIFTPTAIYANINNGAYSPLSTLLAGFNYVPIVRPYLNTCAGTSITVNSGAICAGQSFTITPTGATSYTYEGGSAVVSPTTTTTYSVTGDANGCINTAVSSVTVNAIPTISVTSGAICSGSSFTMTPSGASTYTYSNGNAVVTPTANATYSVSGTDANGCVSNVDAVSSVTVNAIPTISVTSGAICAGQSFTMVSSGADTYTYSNGSSVATPTANATYSVSGTNTLTGCVSNVDAVSSVTVNALPTLTATTSNTIICSGETATLTVSGTATSYTWSTTDNTASIAVTPTTQTTYTVNGTDGNGCSNSTTVTQDVSLCTGIAQNSLTNELTVSPNPSNGIFNINVSTTYNVTILDVLGKVIYSEQLPIGTHSINLNNYSNGLYILKAESNGQSRTLRLVKH